MDNESLISRLLEFDPSDEYHTEGPHPREIDPYSYYAAIDRAVDLLKGEVVNWQSPNPRKKP